MFTYIKQVVSFVKATNALMDHLQENHWGNQPEQVPEFYAEAMAHREERRKQIREEAAVYALPECWEDDAMDDYVDRVTNGYTTA